MVLNQELTRVFPCAVPVTLISIKREREKTKKIVRKSVNCAQRNQLQQHSTVKR